MLRNQIFHGSSTYEGRVNRSQLKVGVAFLRKFVPLVIHIALENPNVDWGQIRYPVVEQNYH